MANITLPECKNFLITKNKTPPEMGGKNITQLVIHLTSKRRENEN